MGFEPTRMDVCGPSRKFRELLHRKAGLSNQRPQSYLGEFIVVGYRQSPARWDGVPEKHVAAVLLIECVANSTESADGLAARNYRPLHQPATSMTSSRMLGGTGSPCFFRLFR